MKKEMVGWNLRKQTQRKPFGPSENDRKSGRNVPKCEKYSAFICGGKGEVDQERPYCKVVTGVEKRGKT